MKNANELSLREMKEIKGGGIFPKKTNFFQECDPDNPCDPKRPCIGAICGLMGLDED